MAKTAEIVVTDWSNQSLYGWGAAITTSGTNLLIPADTTYPNAWPASEWDITDSHFAVELVAPPNLSNGSTSMNIGVAPPNGDDAFVGWEADELRVSIFTAGVWTYHGYIPYDPATHRYLRIRETAGTLYFEAGPDTANFPTLVHSTPTPWDATAIRPYIGAGNWDAAPDPGVATWGAVNPPAPVNLIPAAVKMRDASGNWISVTLRLLPLRYIQVDAKVTNSEYWSLGSTSAQTVNKPFGTREDDLLIFTASSSYSSDGPTIAPPGFTQLAYSEFSATGFRAVAAYKYATATEPDTYTYHRGAGAAGRVELHRVTGANLDVAPTATIQTSASSATAHDAPGITPTTDRNLILSTITRPGAGGTEEYYHWLPPEGYTEHSDGHAWGYATQATASITHNTTDPVPARTWTQVTNGVARNGITITINIPSGIRMPQPVVEDPPALPAVYSGGSGGALADLENESFEDNGITSTYHLYAAGLDWSKRVGLMVYGDGSGEFGLNDPTDVYLMAGPDGLIAAAKRLNMVLLTPKAPGDGCTDGDGVCWYMASLDGTTQASKIAWSKALIDNVLNTYDIDRTRIVLGGYSSGAQWATEYFGPMHAADVMVDGLIIPISYGGQPVAPATYNDEFRRRVKFVWDTGNDDPAYKGATVFDIPQGKQWHDYNGFSTDLVQVGGPHSGAHRSGQFGKIMERETNRHVISTDGAAPPGAPQPTPGVIWLRDLTTKSAPASGTDKTALVPFSAQPGDVLLCILTVYGTGAGNGALPAGFTLLRAHNRTTTHRLMVGYRTRVAGDPWILTPTVPTACSYRMDLLAYQNATTTGITAPALITTTARIGNHDTPSLTPTTNNGMLIGLVSGGGNNEWQPPATMRDLTDSMAVSGHWVTLSAAQENTTSTTATGTRTFVNSAGAFSQIAGSIYIPSSG